MPIILRILFLKSIISLFLKFIDADPNILQIDTYRKEKCRFTESFSFVDDIYLFDMYNLNIQTLRFSIFSLTNIVKGDNPILFTFDPLSGISPIKFNFHKLPDKGDL